MTAPVPARLARKRFLARSALLFEGIWPAIWPALGLIGLFLIAALLGLPGLLPPTVHFAVLVVLGVAIVGLLAWRLRRVALPTNRMADRRLERVSGLSNRPLATLDDQVATADPLGQALWQAHTRRTAVQIDRLRAGLPHPGLAKRDPRALRLAVLIGLVAAFGIAGVNAPRRIMAALTPGLPTIQTGPAPQVQAWVIPPAYTRIAPIFLKPEGGTASVPAGSHLTVNVSGVSDPPELTLNDHTDRFGALDDHSFQAETNVTKGGVLHVRRDGSDMAAWALTVVVDEPPSVAWREAPGHARAAQQTRLPWAVADDYGVTSLTAEIRLRDRPDAPPLIVSIPLPGGTPKEAHGVSAQDLTAHPWAGLPVIGHLVARDAANQSGTSADAQFEIAERPFHNPAAQMLIAARKSLSLHPDDRSDAVGILDQLLQRPELFKDDNTAFLTLSTTYYLLVENHEDSAVPEAQQRLWELALHLEEGQSERTAAALEQARRDARQAMDKAQQNPTDANRRELAQRLQALQHAIEQHMQALLQQAMRNDGLVPFDPKTARLSDRNLQRMLEQAERSVNEGKMADAQQQMSQLERMLDQLRNAQTAKGDNRQTQTKRQRGRDQRSVVQDLIAREGGLLDRSQQRGAQQPQDGGGNDQRQADGRTQGALREALGELMQQFTDLSGQASQGLGDADQAMREALGRLGEGDDVGAGEAQRDAIEALQKGNREMAQAMSKMGSQSAQSRSGQNGQQQGQGDGQSDGDGDDDQDGASGMMGLSIMPGNQQGEASGDDAAPDDSDPNGRDPLGRTAQGNSAASNDVVVPGGRERQRTQAIEEELRRRGANQERPRQELDYIDRLLKQF
jgi:uncharacterized protein (TIGR02302 family)